MVRCHPISHIKALNNLDPHFADKLCLSVDKQSLSKNSVYRAINRLSLSSDKLSLSINSVYQVKHLVYREKLCLSAMLWAINRVFLDKLSLSLDKLSLSRKTLFIGDKLSFSTINRVSRDKLCLSLVKLSLSPKNLVFRAINRVYRAINRIYRR